MAYEQYRGFALKIVFRYIYRYDRAVELTNDGFVKLFQHIRNFRMHTTEEDNQRLLMGYIRKIMVNTCIDELRKGRMLPEIGGIPGHVWDFSNKDDDADQQLLYKQVIELVKELPPQYRVVFNMYVVDGYNHLEIATLLGIPEGTSKSNLSRARALLQANIKKLEEISVCSI